ncbi:MAG: radical SAM protein [Candidatus Omnitrophota bacterium]
MRRILGISYPDSLNIFLTPRCNLECPYCFVNKDGHKGREIGQTPLKKAIDILWQFPGKYKTVSFTGGEPFLRFGEIQKIYPYIQRQQRNNPATKLMITIATNGTLLNRSSYRFLKENGIIFKISIDGKRKIHDANRPFKFKKYGSSYDRITDNLKRLRCGNNDGYKINAQLVFGPSAVENLLDNIIFLWRMGFTCIDFYPDLYARWSEDELHKAESAFREFADFYLSLFKNRAEKKGIFQNSLLQIFIKETGLYKPLHCDKINLDWKGNFYCCDKVFSLPESKRREFVIGNTRKGINNPLRLKLLEAQRSRIRDLTAKDCRRCEYVKYCFCPIGHYIYFSAQGMDFKRYFPQFCRLSQVYIRNFSRIKKKLELPHHRRTMINKNTAVVLAFLTMCFLAIPFAAYSEDSGQAVSGREDVSLDDIAMPPIRYQSPLRMAILQPDEIVRALNIKPGDVILDIGAGAGTFAFRFADALKSTGAVFATDISRENIGYLVDKADEGGYRNVFPILVQIAGLDAFYKKHLFDIIFLCDVYEHIYHPEEYFNELRPFLAQEAGRLYIMYFRSDNVLFEEEFTDFNRMVNILASQGSDFPITRRTRKELRDFIRNFRKDTVPGDIKKKFVEDFNKMLYDRQLLDDLNSYFVTKENNASFMDYVNEVDRNLANWLIESLDSDGVFEEGKTELSDRNKKELRQLNKILIKAFSLSPIIYSAADWIHISKRSVVAKMERAGYALVQDSDFLKYYDFLEFKRRY